MTEGILEANPHFGRHRITMAMWTLGVFVAASRVRNALLRFGAVGRHNSIAVTERAILALKHQWLNRVPVIRELNHLADFECWYSDHRGHMTLGGVVSSANHQDRHWQEPDRSSEALPRSIQRRFFPDVRITASRLAA